MTRISVAMATYNGEQHVREQLDSLARQTVPPYELVITDDGSTDGTLSIVSDFARSSPFPLRIYQNHERLNYSKNFMYAASLCRGDWIAFCDQDDVWLDSKFAIVSDRISRYPEAWLIQHSGIMTDQKLVSTGVLLPDFPRDSVLPPLCETGFVRETKFVGYAMIFRANLLALSRAVRYPSGTYYDESCDGGVCAHDRYVHMLATVFGTIVQIAEPLVLYRRHEAAVTAKRCNPALFRQASFVERLGSKFTSLNNKKKQDTLRWEKQFSELADILKECTLHDPVLARRAEMASLMYRQRAALFSERRKLYHRRSVEKIRGLWNLIEMSAYRSKNSGGIGLPGLFSDMIKLIL
jgi:glycosyltransferase involved in cell wall biosynthesis